MYEERCKVCGHPKEVHKNMKDECEALVIEGVNPSLSQFHLATGAIWDCPCVVFVPVQSE